MITDVSIDPAGNVWVANNWNNLEAATSRTHAVQQRSVCSNRDIHRTPPPRTVRAAFPHTAPTSDSKGEQLPYAFQRMLSPVQGLARPMMLRMRSDFFCSRISRPTTSRPSVRAHTWIASNFGSASGLPRIAKIAIVRR